MKSATAQNTRTICQSIKCTLPLDFPPILCHTYSMTQTQYTRQQLIDALVAEHTHYEHDDDELMPVDEFTSYVNTLSVEQLIDETCCDETYTLDEFMSTYYS